MVVSCDLGSGPDGFTSSLLQSSYGLFSVPQVSSSERWAYSAEDISGLVSSERLKAEAGSRARSFSIFLWLLQDREGRPSLAAADTGWTTF